MGVNTTDTLDDSFNTFNTDQVLLELSTLVLFGAALAGVLLRARRKKA